MGDITSSNSTFVLSAARVFGQIYVDGYSVDDMFGVDTMEIMETMMGLSQNLAYGLIPVAVKNHISLMADSPSLPQFDLWYQMMKQTQSVIPANGVIVVPSTGYIYTLTNGVMNSYSPMSEHRKVQQPRKFGFTWESISTALL